MAGGKTDCEEWNGRVQDLGEEIRGEREGADGVEHWEGKASETLVTFLPLLSSVHRKSVGCRWKARGLGEAASAKAGGGFAGAGEAGKTSRLSLHHHTNFEQLPTG